MEKLRKQISVLMIAFLAAVGLSIVFYSFAVEPVVNRYNEAYATEMSAPGACGCRDYAITYTVPEGYEYHWAGPSDTTKYFFDQNGNVLEIPNIPITSTNTKPFGPPDEMSRSDCAQNRAWSAVGDTLFGPIASFFNEPWVWYAWVIIVAVTYGTRRRR